MSIRGSNKQRRKTPLEKSIERNNITEKGRGSTSNVIQFFLPNSVQDHPSTAEIGKEGVKLKLRMPPLPSKYDSKKVKKGLIEVKNEIKSDLASCEECDIGMDAKERNGEYYEPHYYIFLPSIDPKFVMEVIEDMYSEYINEFKEAVNN